MKLILVGHGRMGMAVESLAERDGHEVVATVEAGEWDHLSTLHAQGELAGVDAAIEFTLPDQVLGNVTRLMDLGLPVVVGTTGWEGDLAAVEAVVDAASGSLVYGSNFSVGVYAFDRVVGFATSLFSRIDDVSAYLVEHHHDRKVDAPSGTARLLSQTIRRSKSKRGSNVMSHMPVTSIRAGHEPGRHTVGFDGPFDHVTLTHAARNREGFAAGALLAARLLKGRPGVYRFNDLMNEWFEVE